MTRRPFGLGATLALIHREYDLSETTGSFGGVLSCRFSRLPPLPQIPPLPQGHSIISSVVRRALTSRSAVESRRAYSG